MSATVIVEATYPGAPDAIFAEALDFGELSQSMAGLAHYRGLPEGPAEEGGTYLVDVTFLGLLTVRGHAMHVERLDPETRILQSRERGPGVRRWDHTLSVQPFGDRALWTDTIRVDAGWRTWFMARFCAYIYARRHRTRRALSIQRWIGRGN